VQKLSTPGRLTPQELAQTAPRSVVQSNTVSIVSDETELNTGTITVTADVTPIP
jgi:hypothetical protein